MYKHLSLLIVALLVAPFVYPRLAEATSGACSSHLGVSCSAGADMDGSVICNDGWRGSSVAYSDMVDCRRSCTRPLVYGCSKNVDYLRLSLGVAAGTVSVAQASGAEQLRACKEQIDGYIMVARAYNLCLEAENALGGMSALSSVDSDLSCWQALGIHSKRGGSAGTCVCDEGYVFNKTEDTCVLDLKDSAQDLKTAAQAGTGKIEGPVIVDAEGKCPAFSSVKDSDGVCKCNGGFFGVLGTCVTAGVYCQTRHGVGTTEWDTYAKTCACRAGYQLNASTGQCVSISDDCLANRGPQAVLASGTCTCAEGAMIDPSNGRCESIAVIARRNAVPLVPAPMSSSGALDASPALGNQQASTTLPAAVTPKPSSRYFVGTPRTKKDVLNCLVVANLSARTYYLRGSRAIKKMEPVGKRCYDSERSAKEAKLKKGQ